MPSQLLDAFAEEAREASRARHGLSSEFAQNRPMQADLPYDRLVKETVPDLGREQVENLLEMDGTERDNLQALEESGQALAQGARFDEVCSRLLEIQGRRRSPAA